MSKKSSNQKTLVKKRWSIENYRGHARHLLVICPRCGKPGRLHWDRRIGWYVKHADNGSNTTHKVPGNTSIEVPLHEPRLNLIRYIGGDSFLLPYLSKMIPPHKVYVEVFGGSAPLLLNKPPSPVEVYNDLDGNLVNLFNVIRDHPEALSRFVEWSLNSRELYYEALKGMKNERDPVKRAYYTFIAYRMAYSGKLGGLGFGPRKRADYVTHKLLDMLKLLHKRVMHVYVEQLDFRELIKRYDTNQTFFYLDPPHLYLSTESQKGRAYYNVAFTDKDYMELLDLLENIKGRFLLKQATEIPWLFKWAMERGYTIHKIRIKKSARADSKAPKLEDYVVYLIANYKIRAGENGLK